ncbi:hypothetical protein LTR84_006374 [Exophiala bonariae]|uniref:DJ-1/PfpI domain-containing protein n=1 Tax=Exophiala bonariae TaxID=1690606 RepID=A0AAV9N4H7_9EURO|nr:hypothetical protein LTR84_006374 [Exophiala bonariae]
MASTSSPVDLSNPGRRLRVGVILVNSKTEILDVAPVDIFSGISKAFLPNLPGFMMSDKMRDEALDVEFFWVNESGDHAELTGGMSVKPTHTFETCPPLDIALMGAHDAGYMLSPGEIAFIRKTHDDCAAFIAICGGFLCVLQAGLLAGKTATAPRPFVAHLRNSNPEVNWVEKRYVRDGKIWTSGALLNGVDLVAAFAEEFWGGGVGKGKEKAEPNDLVEFSLRLGAYPRRDVEYRDVPWVI